ncbi:HEXXH motif domain-containing protein [Streptomyces sp. SLBN-31]|uniref:HEXXH motif domain-containing protein n=1 Tax=Streptomyces sp. SLBN-31 TaxID=2768444 RepID=UPI00115208BD|nr:HEXXH motif domain-containing protein [Streptomyces sp. SLBN-31]TQJ91306.1 HEXXH motif-containing protein [Streptomyces sp. SLBN-31]
MGADVGATKGRPAFHSLSAEDVPALVQDGDPGRFVMALLRAERSRRMLLLRAFLDRVRQDKPAEAATVTQAWDLLERAQRVVPELVEEILMSPGTGVWVSSALRRLTEGVSGQIPLWVVTGRLSALAVAAATRARLPFAMEVPLHRGTVSLPGLGCARFQELGGKSWASAHAVGQEGALRVTAADVEVHVEPEWHRPTPDWLPTRRLTVGERTSALHLVLEEHDPYRMFSSPRAPRFLHPAEDRVWRSSLDDAWNILMRDDPVVAEEFRCGPLLSLAPTDAREKFRPFSSSAGEAFGGISASLPDSPTQLAATLVHEFQHIKLGALIHLEPLLRRADNANDQIELFYAPWRDDPRPLEGMIQGIYAFFGMANFWRGHRRNNPASLLADFEFALCRNQVWTTLKDVGRHHRLTPLGRRLMCLLGERCEAWAAEEVSRTGMYLAHEVATDHRARWRAHHLRPSQQAVDEAVSAWKRGDSHPPTLLAAAPRSVPDSGAVCLDTAATLARHTIDDPEGCWVLRAEDQVSGTGPADVLLALGERSAARPVLLEQLRAGKPPAAAWPLLGRALADEPAQGEVSRFLLNFPERIRAVHEALNAAGLEHGDPLRLAAWLAKGR